MADVNPDLVTIIINNPMFWIVILFALGLLLLRELNKGKLKPEQKPDFGVKYRAKRVLEHLEKRQEHFGVRPKKSYLFRDVHVIGKIKSIDDIPFNKSYPKTNPYNTTLISIFYRRLGFVGWLKGLFGFGIKKIVVEDEEIKAMYDKKKPKRIDYVINKDMFFRERGGILILAREPEKRFIDEINADADYENAKGFVSDFPRRLSNLSPSHAIHGDTMELESSLVEKAEEKKRRWWGGGK